jgi:hypothetical protein
MTARSPDAERLAALLDGRLDARGREELLAELANSPETLEVLADATVALRETEESRGDAAPPPADDRVAGARRPEWFFRRGPLMMLVAALLLAVVVPLGWRKLDWGRRAGSAELAALVPDPRPDAFTGGAQWSVTRGSADALSERATGVRLGARVVDLQIAARMRDTVQVASIATEIASTLAGVPGGSAASGALSEAAHGVAAARQSAASLASVVRDARSLVREDWFDMGAWAESARIAAGAQHAAFFTAFDPRSLIAGVSQDPQLDAADRRLLEALRSHSASLDYPAIARTAAEFLRSAGGT